MLVFVATALSATLIGWPCSRLNWGWRNVWSTCSINSFAPFGTGTEPPAETSTGFRFNSVIWTTPSAPQNFPTSMLASTGVFTPRAVGGLPMGNGPAMLCAWAPNTGAGATAVLRNRCRRAIDAYGALVSSCAAPPGISIRGLIPAPPSNTPLFTDWAPSATTVPHVSNVQGLTQNAQLCLMPAGAYAPVNLNTPANVCPGLLGWFTVVFNACGFTNAPGLSTNPQVNVNLPNIAPNGAGNPYVMSYFPTTAATTVSGIGASVLGPYGLSGPSSFAGTDAPSGQGATPAQQTSVGVFCSPRVVYSGVSTTLLGQPIRGPAGATPISWNDVGVSFRTSRCRKALDQFGRTAARCEFGGGPNIPAALGTPSQAGGYSDPLRLLAIGAPVGNTPLSRSMGFSQFAPLCN